MACLFGACKQALTSSDTHVENAPLGCVVTAPGDTNGRARRNNFKLRRSTEPTARGVATRKLTAFIRHAA
jgi:hypothetical protein